MNSFSLEHGRVNQKMKTRTRILDAAKQLMAESNKITLEEVAKKAAIGRATIYRYFPNIELLVTEASLDIHFLSSEELFNKAKDLPVTERILFIQNYYNTMAQDHELIFRRYLSATLVESMTSKKKIRGARRVETMRLALSSLKGIKENKELENLINAATILMGIEPAIVATDVCGLSKEASKKTLNWALEMILKGMSLEG